MNVACTRYLMPVLIGGGASGESSEADCCSQIKCWLLVHVQSFQKPARACGGAQMDRQNSRPHREESPPLFGSVGTQLL